MRMSLLCSVVSIVLATGAAFAQGEGEFPATLKGHAVLPAQSFVDAPADAPADLKTAGKYTTGRRVDAIGSVMGKSYERPTGVSLPFKGQPLQGHSGIKRRRSSCKIPTGRCRSVSFTKIPPSAISPVPISTPKAFRSSATISGSATNSVRTS